MNYFICITEGNKFIYYQTNLCIRITETNVCVRIAETNLSIRIAETNLFI